MPEQRWELTKFYPIYSYPADLPENSEIFAQDMANLRINRWGHLRPRPSIQALPVPPAHAPVGVAGVQGTADHLYWLHTDSKLFRASDLTRQPIEIMGADRLHGNLTVIGEFQDFDIIHSERGDSTYILYYDRVPNALPLSAPRPVLDQNFRIEPRGSGDTADYYFYKITYADRADFPTIESEATPRRSAQLFLDPDGEGQFALLHGIPAPTDDRLKAICVYRSALSFTTNDVDDTTIRYYRIGCAELPDNVPGYYIIHDKTKTTSTADTEADDEVLIDVNFPLRDNSPMPARTQQIAKYKDRLFAATGTELRYSDVRHLTPLWGSFPKANHINTGTRIDFCAPYAGVLLFGGRDGLFRLTGDAPPYDFDQIAAKGAVSPQAWAVLSFGFGFVSVDGIYLTDGAVIQETGAALKGYFNNHYIENGVVGELPSKSRFWGMTRRDTNGTIDTRYFVEDNDNGGFTRIETDDLHPITQLDTTQLIIPDGNGTGHYNTIFAIADGQRTPRTLNWIVDADGIETDTIGIGYTHTQNVPIQWKWESQALAWNEQGLGETMKRFIDLQISGLADPAEIKITFYVDDKPPMVVKRDLNRELTSRFHPLKVRIDRWGYAIRFTIEGAGDVTIRGLKLMIEV